MSTTAERLAAERFVQEITTTAALQHPHILPLFDSGEADGFLYYVMPFVDGETLRSKLDRETQLGVDEAVKLASEVADALHHAHERGGRAAGGRDRVAGHHRPARSRGTSRACRMAAEPSRSGAPTARRCTISTAATTSSPRA